MKKLFNMRTLLLAILALSLVNCSKDQLTTTTDLSQEEINLTKTTNVLTSSLHSLFETTPNEKYNQQSKGLYHGVFSTNDLTIKGKIYISVGNDNLYAAEVELLNGKRLRFEAEKIDLYNFHFFNEKGSFDFNVEDFENTIADNVIYDNKEGYIRAYKDNSNARRMMGLGTFISTDGGPVLTGNWDLVLGGQHPNDAGQQGWLRINDIIITFNGQNFNDTDNVNENMGNACTNVNWIRAAYHPSVFGLGEPSLQGMNQISKFNGVVTNWSAKINPWVCDTEGTWSRNGRSGTFSFN